MEDFKIKYENALSIMKDIHSMVLGEARQRLEEAFPELAESKSEDERIRKALIKLFSTNEKWDDTVSSKDVLAWLEKQGSEPNWCHHKVDLSDCSEEYCKAYYDGWNNCNMQHSQCKSELDDVLKCLINGMKFYYEDNKDATWGTDKWSMPVKYIIEVLEKQGEQKPVEWSDEDKSHKNFILELLRSLKNKLPEFANQYQASYDWLKSLRPQKQCGYNPYKESIVAIKEMIGKYHTFDVTDLTYLRDLVNNIFVKCKDAIEYDSLFPQKQWKPSDEQMLSLERASNSLVSKEDTLILRKLLEQLKKLSEE